MKGLNVLCEKIECPMRRGLIQYFIIVFERECDARVEKKIDFQFFSIYYYVNHIFFII